LSNGFVRLSVNKQTPGLELRRAIVRRPSSKIINAAESARAFQAVDITHRTNFRVKFLNSLKRIHSNRTLSFGRDVIDLNKVIVIS
jgi:hypothetical protein